MKFSKFKKFKLITGRNFLEVAEKLKSDNYDERLESLEFLALGCHLLEIMNVSEARSEFVRLQKIESEQERYSIIDNVDIDKIIKDI